MSTVHDIRPPRERREPPASAGSGPSPRAGSVRRVIAAHPVAAVMLWFFTVGQAIAFVPLIAAGAGASLPGAPFVMASNLLGLALPAVLVTWAADGRGGLRDLGRRLARRRVGARWYAFALVVVPLVTVALAVVLSGPPRADSVTGVAWAVLAGLLLQTVLGLVTSNLAEEMAWTGVVQARLQRRRGPLVAALLTGPLFALQHLSLAVANAGSQALLLLVLLVALAVPFRALLGWTYNRTGSLLLVGLVHAAGNASAAGSGVGDGLLTLLYPGQAPGPLHLVGAALLGLVVVVATRGRLGRPRPRAAADLLHTRTTPTPAARATTPAGTPTSTTTSTTTSTEGTRP